MRRRSETPLPSADRWLLSWSDFVTLLLALFAAMYASSSIDRTKSDAVVRSVGAALGAPADEALAAPAAPPGTPGAGPLHGEGRGPEEGQGGQGSVLADELASALAALGLGDRVQVRVEGGMVGIDIDAELLFREGDAALSDSARALLTDIARVLHDRPHAIRVEGHTDSTPIANSRYASNWELSSARAAVVVRQLAAAGIAEGRMSAVGMAANRPLGHNDTPQGRALNRRVHLVLLN